MNVNDSPLISGFFCDLLSVVASGRPLEFGGTRGNIWGNRTYRVGEPLVMATTTLTTIAAAKAKPRAKKYKLAPGGGLYLEVMPSGAKYWRLKYRYAGKEKRIALGVFGDVSLSEARRRRDDEKARLRNGTDPAADRRTKKLAIHLTAANSFEAVAREWLETKRGEWVPEHFEKVRAWFEQHVFPWIGSASIEELDAPVVLAMLRRIVNRGTFNTAVACGRP